MHAYLLIGKDTSKKEEEILSGLNSTSIEFPIIKIEEVRSLTGFLKNTQSENTVIIARNIDEATTEAINAFLKSLEEPQKNVSFILTAKNEYKVLPTILSRCQVVKITNYKLQITNENAERFIKSGAGERLLIVDKIKGRNEAVEFVQNLIEELQHNVNKTKANFSQIANCLEISQKTLNNLNANGNVNLQLTALVVNLNSSLDEPKGLTAIQQ